MANKNKFVRISVIIIFMLLIIMTAKGSDPIEALTKPVICSEDEVRDPDPDTGYIYQGVWSDSLNPFDIVPLRLSGFNRQCLATSSSNYNHLEVIQFIGDSWQYISRIPVSISHIDYPTGICWTTGDLDNDSSDEIIVCYDS